MGDPFGLVRRGITDARVLAAMATVPRASFVPPEHVREAMADHPLPIGHDQTISQPFIVAWMTQALEVSPGDRVLEIGTGSGYQTAILAALGAEVFSIEIETELSARASRTLQSLGITNVTLRVGDGHAGWPEEAPFDRVILTAAPPRLPQALVDQLADGGRLVAPIGDDEQVLVTLIRRGDRLQREETMPVRFVPMRHAPPGTEG